jgi:hypothetical protein
VEVGFGLADGLHGLAARLLDYISVFFGLVLLDYFYIFTY